MLLSAAQLRNSRSTRRWLVFVEELNELQGRSSWLSVSGTSVQASQEITVKSNTG